MGAKQYVMLYVYMSYKKGNVMLVLFSFAYMVGTTTEIQFLMKLNFSTSVI